MAAKILITGITGFAGSHLAEYLVGENADSEFYGTYLSDDSLRNIEAVENQVSLTKLDLSNEKEVFELIDRVKPDIIFHLAAMSSSADSFSSPAKPMLNNIHSEINILEGVRRSRLIDSKILIISSAEIYGAVDKNDLPIDENVSLRPTNPYAVSKLTQDFLGLQYFLSYNFKIIRVRPFNHIGPRQSTGFVVAAFAKKIAEIEKGKKNGILTVGNLEAKRDFTDVRDMVRAYDLAISKGVFGEVYNLGFGISYKISDILNRMVSLSKAKIKVEVDRSLFRPIDNPDLVCNATKFKKLTGWEPKIEIEQTLKDTLDYWRNII
ncbi:MAG: GDP-mannose 4,6-dehydratase [Patescibacteria group bacterium]|nr:GDP-mannose 4,6-dehydratase [Patescibacteria group bacterium]